MQPAARACVALRLADYEAALPELERRHRQGAGRSLLAAVPPDRAEAPRPAGWARWRCRRGSAAWPAPLFALLAGTATPDAVLAAATTDGRRAEALFQLERFKEVAETRAAGDDRIRRRAQRTCARR